ncbi:hypothetical protein LTS18_010581 [Coniosporium uncinatum]|uniref:Uncharacterized protein n=1 Tax=Coniosporium uncinatum TaxID=93489 RepID=A0ACC3DKU3_9PEZI|nr:hypothetical protein LTS18_010581 [Coniosporium uncinatum]
MATVPNEDPFDSLLSLEDDFYEEGYNLGVADGSKAGRIEGRVFGMEKAFEKFLSMGQMNGKAAVWGSRLPQQRDQDNVDAAEIESPRAPSKNDSVTVNKNELPLLGNNSRLAKHIQTLHALAEPESLSTQNNEEAVSDFDDRFKRAVAKAKVIENIMHESDTDVDSFHPIEAVSALKTDARTVKLKRTDAPQTDSMEDFGASQRRG